MALLKLDYFKQFPLVCSALALLMAAGTVEAQTPDKVNDFPVFKSVEAYNGRSALTSVSFNIYFPADDNRYLPIREELAAKLAAAPLVRADRGMQARVISTQCIPKRLLVEMGSGFGYVEGAVVQCHVEITPTPSANRGEHEVRFSFALIDLVNQEVNRLTSASTAVAVFRVDVWPSPEAKQAMLRSAEVQREKEAAAKADALRQKKELDRQKLRLQEELEAQAWRETVKDFAWKAGTVLAFVLPLGTFFYKKRKWWRPEMELELAQGEHKQLRAAVHGPREGAEPGTVLQTMWASAFWGRRHRIKLETFSSEDNSEISELHSVKAGRKNNGSERKAVGGDNKLDLLVTVGASVRPGFYLSKVRNRNIRIKIVGT